MSRFCPIHAKPICLFVWTITSILTLMLVPALVRGQQPSAGTAPAKQVRVRVVDQHNKPISKSVVQVATFLTDTDLRTNISPGQLTGDDGTITFSYPANHILHAVVAQKNQVGLDFQVYKMAGPELPARPQPAIGKVEEVTLTLAGALDLRVKVVDENGKPQPNTEVHFWFVTKKSRGAYHLNVSGLVDQKKVTDTEGMVRFQNLPADASGQLIFFATRKAGSAGHMLGRRATWRESNPTSELTLVLPTPVECTGIVVDRESKPVAGAEVKIRAVPLEESLDTDHFPKVVSDSAGKFRFTMLAQQMLAVYAEKEHKISRQRRFEIHNDAPKDLLLILKPGIKLQGTVTTDRPITSEDEPISVHAEREAWSHTLLPPELQPKTKVRTEQQERIDQRLRFSRSAPVKDGKYTMYLPAGEYFVCTAPKAGRFQQLKLLESDTEETLNFELELMSTKKGKLRGRVVKETNPSEGIAGLEVRYHLEKHTGGHPPRFLITNQDGYFESEVGDVILELHAEDRSQGLACRANWSTGDPDMLLKLRCTCTVRGRALDRKGQPLPSHRILANTAGHQTFTSTDTQFCRVTMTDSDGRFEFKGLVRDQEYRLIAYGKPGADARGPIENVRDIKLNDPDQPLELGDLRIPFDLP